MEVVGRVKECFASTKSPISVFKSILKKESGSALLALGDRCFRDTERGESNKGYSVTHLLKTIVFFLVQG